MVVNFKMNLGQNSDALAKVVISKMSDEQIEKTIASSTATLEMLITEKVIRCLMKEGKL